tara:strand:- start:458 stop:700 length:243 start_codon:yes stop_codon:yes gene_type:complete
MDTTVLIVIFSILCLTFLILGGIIGWLAQQNNYVNMQNQGAFSTHPEMYDENGNLIADEIVALRFENPNDNSEEDDDEEG